MRSKTRDDWAGPEGERESVRLAKPAWDLYGAGDAIEHSIADGVHALEPRDWDHFLDVADRRLVP